MTTSLLNSAPLFLSTGELARLLGRHPRTLRNWRDEGKGPLAVRLGYKWAYRRQDIDAYLDSLAGTAGNGRWQGPKQQPDVAESPGVQPAPAMDATVAA
jgi:hypothetical protein